MSEEPKIHSIGAIRSGKLDIVTRLRDKMNIVQLCEAPIHVAHKPLPAHPALNCTSPEWLDPSAHKSRHVATKVVDEQR